MQFWNMRSLQGRERKENPFIQKIQYRVKAQLIFQCLEDRDMGVW